jgi:hypothetical protein
MPSVSTHLKTRLLVSVIFIPSLVSNIRGRIWKDLFIILFSDVGIVTYKLRCERPQNRASIRGRSKSFFVTKH